MATKTTNYNLTKPDGSENADIDVINANMDTIDSALSNKADKSQIPDVSGYLPKSGGTMAGTLNLVENGSPSALWRHGLEGYRSGVAYKTNGNEAVCFENENPVTSWIFRYYNSVSLSGTQWNDVTPSMQIKNQRVVINKLIGNDTDAEYNLDVGGTANATTLYQGGKQVANKEDIPDVSGYATKAELSSGLSGKASTSVATTSANGLMSSTDKVKLDGITAGAQPNTIETVKVNNSAVSVSNKAVNIDLSGYALKSDISSVYKVKGSVGSVSGLPSNASIGDVYNITADGSNYVWTGSEWDALGGTVDLSSYAKTSDIPDVSGLATKTELSSGLSGKADKSEIPDTSKMMTTDTAQTITGAKAFTGTVGNTQSSPGIYLGLDTNSAPNANMAIVSANSAAYIDMGAPNEDYGFRIIKWRGTSSDLAQFVYGSGGTITVPNATGTIALTSQIPNIVASTTDIGEGSSLATGTLYLVYE